MNQQLAGSINVCLSAIGFGIAFILGFSSSNPIVDTPSKLAVGTAFFASCALGLSMALRPGWYKRKGRREDQPSKKIETSRSTVGHHPDCASFDRHRTRIGERTFCAGCLGITIGSILALFLMATYIIAAQSGMRSWGQSLLLLGSLTIVLAYAEAAYPKRNVALHVFLSAILIVGFLSITIGMLESSGNAIIGLMGILFSFLWMNTRISISHWRHALLCAQCGQPCKSYLDR